jgi:hypothetical protein
VRVEVQNAEGKPLEQFNLTACEPMTGDVIAHTVTWKKGSVLKGLAGQPMRLRFVLENADLYSIQFVP